MHHSSFLQLSLQNAQQLRVDRRLLAVCTECVEEYVLLLFKKTLQEQTERGPCQREACSKFVYLAPYSPCLPMFFPLSNLHEPESTSWAQTIWGVIKQTVTIERKRLVQSTVIICPVLTWLVKKSMAVRQNISSS